MRSEGILLGYDVTSCEPVHIPLHHLVISGVTQLSGKTTTLEALITRSGLRAVAFRTKRGESGFTNARVIPPYFRERTDWLFIQSLLQALMGESMKAERGNIIRICKGAGTLAKVAENTRESLEKARGFDRELLERLNAYFELVLPELEAIPFSHSLKLEQGVNVIDMENMPKEVQSLVIASVIAEVNKKEKGVVVIIPEANGFLPQGKGSPAKADALQLARTGAGIKNFLWMDTQDLAGVDKAHLKQVGVWLLGIQTEQNEVERTLKHIPDLPKPSATMLRSLSVGHFYVCFGGRVQHVYVQPSWMDAETARGVVMRERDDPSLVDRAVSDATKALGHEPMRFAEPHRLPAATKVDSQQLVQLRQENERLTVELQTANTQLDLCRNRCEELDRKVASVKRVFEVEYEGLKCLFVETDGEGFPTRGPRGLKYDMAVWQPWIDKAPGAVKKFIPILIDRGGKATTRQVCTLANIAYETASRKGYWGWLKNNNLATIVDGIVTLCEL